MTLQTAIVLMVCGCAVGFINTLAGGGTVLALSALNFAGLPLAVANGTYRIAATVQTLTSTGTFYRQDRLDLETGLLLGIPAAAGAVLGAFAAIDIDETLFRRIVAVVLIGFFVMLLVRPRRWAPDRKGNMAEQIGVPEVLLFFAVGVYGGFVHVGVGYLLLMAVLFTTGYDLVRSNAVKVMIIFLYLPWALAVFVWGGKVSPWHGLGLAAGQVTGAFLGARFAVEGGQRYVRWVVLAFIAAMVPHLLGFYDLGAVLRGFLGP